MTNDPTSPYHQAINDAQDALDDALAAIRAETTAGRVTPEQAAAERCGLLERHLAELERLRREHLGGS